jgi:hypothetical protein
MGLRKEAGMDRVGKSLRAWLNDTTGSVDAASFILMVTIVALGILCGAATFRDQLVQEFGDIAVDLENLDQSYSITIGTVTSSFADTVPGNIQPVTLDGVAVTGE